MSAPKFTPGPWSFQLCASDKTVYQLLDAHGTVIGFPRAGTGGNAEKASFLANARLIAAAPELYEALQKAIGHLASIGFPADARGRYDKSGSWTFDEAVPRPVDAQEVVSAFNVIRAALAKVNGETP